MYEFNETFNGFIESLNSFDTTYNNLNYSLNNFGIFLKNKVDTIYVRRFKKADPFFIDEPMFETNSYFIVSGDEMIDIVAVTPSYPNEDPAELKKIYLNQLVKLDTMQRKLVLYKGHLYNYRYIYLENATGSNPNVNDTFNHIKER